MRTKHRFPYQSHSFWDVFRAVDASPSWFQLPTPPLTFLLTEGEWP